MSSKKIVEQWVAKYGNNPEVDKIVNERVKYMANNKSMTAVEWLEQKLKDRYSLIHSQPLFEQAKQMEKEQMDDCWRFGRGSYIDKDSETFEQYYNDTYGKDKSND